MSKIHPAAWIGLVINIGLSFFSLEAYGDMPVLSMAMFGGVVLSAVGIVMLAMGQAAGGILGAIGGAVFIPVGLVCMIGCMRTRQALINDAKNVDVNLVNTVFGDVNANTANTMNAGPVSLSPVIHNPAPGSEAAAAAGTVPHSTHGTAAPEGTAASGGTIFRFKDQRMLMAIILGGGILVMLVMASGMYVDISGPIMTFAVIGGISLWTQSRLVAMPALALYEDHLTCVSSQAAWAGENTVMYRLIQKAGISGNKGSVTAHRTDGAGTEELKILFNAMPSNVREEAKNAFAAKMRERGVPFSQS